MRIMKKRILILGAGGPSGLNFIKSLKLNNEYTDIYGTDINKYHIFYAKKEAKKMFLVPKCTDKNYYEIINEIIYDYGIDFVHPQPDIEVKHLSENRDKLNALTFLPSKETIKICQDKFRLGNIWYECGLREDKPEMIEIRQHLTHQELKYHLEHLNKELWLRATEGAGGRGACYLENPETGFHWIRFWRSKDWRKNKTWEQWEWMIQKYLPGRDIAWHSLFKDGELICSQARERVEYIYPHLAPSGRTGTPIVQRTINDDRVNEIAEKAIRVVDPKASGIFCVDLREDEKGIPRPTEINAGRFFTTSMFFSEASNRYNVPLANMPQIYVKLAFDEEIPKGKKYNILPEGIYCIRHIDCGTHIVEEKDI